MKFISTQRSSPAVSLREAVLRGLPPDNGLYFPEYLPQLPASFFERLPSMPVSQIAFEVAAALFEDEIPKVTLQKICEEAFNFEVPMAALGDNIWIQELFHGPTLAFKDFGARFMARLMSYFVQSDPQQLHILVATSGDTGSAVANGFLDVPGIQVTVLYPKGKVSPFQEKQFSTLGRNIHALEIDGTFDDCQRLVKQAFLDKDLCSKLRLSSANSINISRLVPQSVYYFYAYGQLAQRKQPVVFVVPSGNFGNLTAGLMAREMGLPVHHFVAATNLNKIVPDYLTSGIFSPKASVATISNAMDVGNPSNFARMSHLYSSTNDMAKQLSAYFADDERTRQIMQDIYHHYGYVIDPHAAVGYAALMDYRSTGEAPTDAAAVILGTAHPVKFAEVVESTIGYSPSIPQNMAHLMHLPKLSIGLGADFEGFKNWLLQTYHPHNHART